MRGPEGLENFEWLYLGDGELIVNVTDVPEISRVTAAMAQEWTWDGVLFDWTPEEDEEGPTEWICLQGAQKRPQSLTAV